MEGRRDMADREQAEKIREAALGFAAAVSDKGLPLMELWREYPGTAAETLDVGYPLSESFDDVIADIREWADGVAARCEDVMRR